MNISPIYGDISLTSKLITQPATKVVSSAITKFNKLCFLDMEVLVDKTGGGWNHFDTLMNIPEGFKPISNRQIIMIPRRKIQFDCRVIASGDGRIWIHSSEGNGSRFLETDYLVFIGIWVTH